MEIFDTHAHYDDRAFDEDREELLKALTDNGITRIVNISEDIRFDFRNPMILSMAR